LTFLFLTFLHGGHILSSLNMLSVNTNEVLIKLGFFAATTILHPVEMVSGYLSSQVREMKCRWQVGFRQTYYNWEGVLHV
jgi:hypothetical protein